MSLGFVDGKWLKELRFSVKRSLRNFVSVVLDGQGNHLHFCSKTKSLYRMNFVCMYVYRTRSLYVNCKHDF